MNSTSFPDEPGPEATEAQLADYYNAHPEAVANWGPAQPIERSERLDVTISVRFSPAEIATLRARAQAAGMKPTAYIRQSALEAQQNPLDRARLKRALTALSQDLEDLQTMAS